MFKEIGHWLWWPDIPTVEIDGDIYALSGWNGEKYLDCWQCVGEFNLDASDERYIITPVWEEISEDEWEIIDYDVRYA